MARLDGGRAEARRAYALHRRGQLASATSGYRAALALDPAMADVWFALGALERARGALGEAARCLRRARTLRHDWPTADLELGRALFQLGEVDQAVKFVRLAADASDVDTRRAAATFLAVILPGSPRADNQAILEARRRFALVERASQLPLAIPKPRAMPPPGKIRIGYVSAFFGFANWMRPVWGVINHHDRTAFEIHLFADGAPPSEESGYRAQASDVVHETTRATNEGLARRIALAGIDVLVDLNAYSAPRRLGMFMRRPAPVLVGWFNSYATSGIDAFDYIIGDPEVVPPSEERFYTERVLRVPRSYIAFSVLHPCPEIVPPPCVAAGHLTFGSLASQYKITDAVVSAWSTILNAAPAARLFMKNRALDDASTRAHLLRKFARRGIGPSRITLEGSADHWAFLEAHARVDVALDPFPYSGGATTMEALWQGVPVLTFNGDRWASRTSRSLVVAAGLKDWCETSIEGYVDRAIALARSRRTPPMLASLRRRMRACLRSSPVCDSAGLARVLEALYGQIARSRSSL